MTFTDVMRHLGERLARARASQSCGCERCRPLAPRPRSALAESVEVYVACAACQAFVQSFDGLRCGKCGKEVADKAMDRLYDGTA